MLSTIAGIGIGLIAIMFLPVLIALLRGRFLVALVVFVMVVVSIFALHTLIFGVIIWIAALCVSAFAGRPKVIIVNRPR